MREYIEGQTELLEGEKILSVKAALGEGHLVEPIVSNAKIQVASALGELFLPNEEIVVSPDELERVRKRVEEKVDGRHSFVEIGTDRIEVQIRTNAILDEAPLRELGNGPDPGNRTWTTGPEWGEYNKRGLSKKMTAIGARLKELDADPSLAEEVYEMREDLFTRAKIIQRQINTHGARVWIRIKDSYEFEHQKQPSRIPIFKIDSSGHIKPMTLTDVRKWIAETNRRR